jgi:hypothetical protein
MNGVQLVDGEICEKYYLMYEYIGVTWTGANDPLPNIFFYLRIVFFWLLSFRGKNKIIWGKSGEKGVYVY